MRNGNGYVYVYITAESRERTLTYSSIINNMKGNAKVLDGMNESAVCVCARVLERMSGRGCLVLSLPVTPMMGPLKPATSQQFRNEIREVT